MKLDKHLICSRCVMDTSDPEIYFDENGVCNHCSFFDKEISPNWFPNEVGKKRLEQIVDEIKNSGKGKEFDCIIGLSGGVDSSYLAIALKEFGLRPLAIHVDAGWNSELAVHNIEKIVKFCKFDLHTHVMNWEEMRDLQIAFLQSDIANQDIPQDHAFFASIYHFAVENNIRFFISGGNIATESSLPSSWENSAMDAICLNDIHRRFGKIPLKEYKTISFFSYYIYYPLVKKMKTLRPLNYMPYNKESAIQELVEKVGFKRYERKHGESRFTKFFQNHYLPVKFGFDKRRSHLSSLILSGQISREEALKELDKPLYEKLELEEDKAYIAKKLGLSPEDFEDILSRPGKSYKAYKNWDSYQKFAKKLQSLIESTFQKKIRNYS